MAKSRLPESAWIPLGYNEWVTLSEQWELSDKLFKFSPLSRAFTLDHAFRGIKVYGATGSGKTSGFAKVIATSYLDHGFGGLVLCAKGDNDELNNWSAMCKEMGRSKSLIHFGPQNTKHHLRFNILEFIRTLSPNKNESLTDLVRLLKIISSDLQGGKLSQTDSFWDGVTDQYLTHLLTMTINVFKNKELTFERLQDIFDKIQAKEDLSPHLADLKLEGDLKKAINFFNKEFPALNDKTRSIIVASVSTLLFKFNMGTLSEFFGKEGNIDPRWTFSGAVIVINITNSTDGKTANLIWKYAFQKACLNRKMHEGYMRPVFLWADEAQEFIHPDDVKFQATARQFRCSTVYLTQNIAGLRFNLGSGSQAQDAIKSLESNLLTTIFHKNIDPETNQYASSIIGTKKEKIKSTTSKGYFSNEVSENISYRQIPIYSTQDFSELKKGGADDNKQVEAIVFSPGSKLFIDWYNTWFKDWAKITVTQGQYSIFRKNAVGKCEPDFETFLNINNKGV